MINFLKYKTIYFTLSTVVIVIGLFFIFRYGYNLSIDFAGGSVIDYQVSSSVSSTKIKNVLSENKIKLFSIQNASDILHLKTEAIDRNKEVAIRNEIQKQNNVKIEVRRFETVGPVIGQETMHKTVTAALVAILGILIYMTFAFKKISYGIAAIIAMIHDFLVVVGMYAVFSHFFGAELDTLFVTALLTTMSFSVHDTIIVFDKIREYRRYDVVTPIDTLANKAFTETIVRSLNNSLTIMLMLLALVLMGGETIRFFALTLLIGTITGTYSSPFIATPALSWLEKKIK